jgi:MFS family permease
MSLLRTNVAFRFSNLAALINYSATFAVTFMLSLYLQYVQGYGAERAGIVLVSRPVVMAVTSIYAGRLSDRVEPRLLASSGMGLVTAGLVMLVFLGAGSGTGHVVFCLLVLGLGFGLFSSPNTNAVMSSVERRFYGVASGTVSTMRILGQVFSMGIVTFVLAIILGRVPVTPAVHDGLVHSMRITFTIFAGLCFLGIFASLARGRIHTEGSGPA